MHARFTITIEKNVPELESLQRQDVVAEALSWLNTPFHHEAAVKGAGVDCAMLLREVYAAIGLTPRIDPGHYPADWHLHRTEERYLTWILEYARPVSHGLPGDIATYKFGRVISHAAIVVQWPVIIHTYTRGCVLDDGDRNEELKERFVGFYRLKVWAGGGV